MQKQSPQRPGGETGIGRWAILPSAVLPFFLAVSWWLPPDHSRLGQRIDVLFDWIFGFCVAVTLLVFAVLAYFLIRYRHRPATKKARYLRGHTRIEIAWTLTPAVILGVLAYYSRNVWNDYRYAPDTRSADVHPAKIMVIGQQFKWNILYPGPDGKFGRYLIYPKPSDASWPDGSKFMGYSAPRDIPPDQAQSVIGRYIDLIDPLGKDFNDPAGKDDDWKGALGRAMEVPLNRPVDVYVTSKDVIHSLSIPDFRVKLDTVPGMIGIISFTPIGAQTLSAERAKQSRRRYSLDQLNSLLRDPVTSDRRIYISAADAAQGAENSRSGWRFATTDSDHHKITIIRDGMGFVVSSDPRQDTISRLRAIGVKTVVAYRPGYYDIVCQQLCGQGHYTMHAKLYVITNAEYEKKYETIP